MIIKIVRLLLLIILLCFSKKQALTQAGIIEDYLILHQVDSLQNVNDTTQALDLYQQLVSTECFIKAGRNLAMSEIYFSLNKKDKAKQELNNAVDKGLFGLTYIDDDYAKLYQRIERKYGGAFLNELKIKHDKKIKSQLAINGVLIEKIKNIFFQDQALRSDKNYKICKQYNFNKRLGFDYDSTQNQTDMITCYQEFRNKDSLVLQEFVNIIDSIGYVPGTELTYGMIPISPIICHLAHFEFQGLEDKLLYSLFKGTLSPEVYAWYIGYKEEYFKTDPSFYFTNNEQDFDKMSSKKINSINKLRKSIGLKSIPSVLWNSKIY